MIFSRISISLILIIFCTVSCTKLFMKQSPPKALLQAEICKKYAPEFNSTCTIKEFSESIESSKGTSGGWQNSQNKWIYKISTSKESISVSFKVSNGLAELDGMAIDGEMVHPVLAYKTIYPLVVQTSIMKGRKAAIEKQNKESGIESIPEDAR